MSEPARLRVAVVGSANTDLVVSCAHLPQPGETVVGGDVERLSGGKGANQAAALARLGVVTSLIACVGRDEPGEWLLAASSEHGTDTSWVQRSDRPSGTAFITLDAKGENQIVVVPGANEDLDLSRVDLDAFDVVLAQMEMSADAVDKLALRAPSLVLNFAPARAVSAETLRRCTVVIANELESRDLDLGEIAHCVVTQGSRGAVHYSFGHVVARASPPAVDVVDTVGAGDVFCAAYVSRFARDDDALAALRFAVTAGAMATTARGAQGSLPTTEEVQRCLDHAS